MGGFFLTPTGCYLRLYETTSIANICIFEHYLYKFVVFMVDFLYRYLLIYKCSSGGT